MLSAFSLARWEFVCVSCMLRWAVSNFFFSEKESNRFVCVLSHVVGLERHFSGL